MAGSEANVKGWAEVAIANAAPLPNPKFVRFHVLTGDEPFQSRRLGHDLLFDLSNDLAEFYPPPTRVGPSHS
jgi:hypothetical protein